MKVLKEFVIGALVFGGFIGFMALTGAFAEWLVRV